MPRLSVLVSGTICISFLALWAAEAKTKPKLDHDITEVRKIYQAFPSLLAIFDQDEDGDLDCVTAERLEYDFEASTATYAWLLAGGNGHEKRNITFQLKPGPTLDTAIYTLDDDESKHYIVKYPYADYENCLIAELQYRGLPECMLWVTREVKDNIPQKCIDIFTYYCDQGVSLYSQDMCQESQDL
ncbi:uncharacterized protein LOC144157742 [Haemaphysalis longicornis]